MNEEHEHDDAYLDDLDLALMADMDERPIYRRVITSRMPVDEPPIDWRKHGF